MRTRLDFHNLLIQKIQTANKVYFQPPESIKLEYPCVIYSIDRGENWNADDIKYLNMTRYSLIGIDRNPDSHLRDEMDSLMYSEFDRTYQADGLNHFVFTVYF